MASRHSTLAASAAILLSLGNVSPAWATGDLAANGVTCTIVGTEGDDELVGTAEDDVICGLGGQDQISGLAGNDVIDGGNGNDFIFGYKVKRKDDVSPATDSDLIFGSDGSDTMNGGDGNDIVYGNSGNDTLVGGDGKDQLRGGNGNDSLEGSAGTDKIFGESGNDRLGGGLGKDTLDGGVGKDRCGSEKTLSSCDSMDRSGPRISSLKITSGSTVSRTYSSDLYSSNNLITFELAFKDSGTGVSRIYFEFGTWNERQDDFDIDIDVAGVPLCSAYPLPTLFQDGYSPDSNPVANYFGVNYACLKTGNTNNGVININWFVGNQTVNQFPNGKYRIWRYSINDVAGNQHGCLWGEDMEYCDKKWPFEKSPKFTITK